VADHYNLEAGRSKAQVENMKQLAEAGRCFMCYENLITYENNRIEFETDHWIVTPNAYPYEHTTLHLLVIARRHVKTMTDLTHEERADLGEAIAQVEERFKLDSYAFGLRSGDFRYNGASVEHLHGHVVVGKRELEGFEKVRFKMSSLPKSDK
jgi:ATP adenylyltransferase